MDVNHLQPQLCLYFKDRSSAILYRLNVCRTLCRRENYDSRKSKLIDFLIFTIAPIFDWPLFTVHIFSGAELMKSAMNRPHLTRLALFLSFYALNLLRDELKNILNEFKANIKTFKYFFSDVYTKFMLCVFFIYFVAVN